MPPIGRPIQGKGVKNTNTRIATTDNDSIIRAITATMITEASVATGSALMTETVIMGTMITEAISMIIADTGVLGNNGTVIGENIEMNTETDATTARITI